MIELALQLIEENKKNKDTFLDLGRCGLEYELPKELSACVWLKQLNLGARFYDENLGEVLQSKNKRSENIFKGDELATLVNLPNLEALYLCSALLNDHSFLEKLPQLQILDISDNQIKEAKFLEKLTKLHSLDLSFNLVRDIRFLEKITQLQTLILRENEVNDTASFEKLTELRTLDLRFNKIRDIRFLEKLKQLRALHLSGNQIKDYSHLEKLTELRVLDLRNNRIQEIVFLEKLTELQLLDLRFNQIKDIKPLSLLIKNGLDVNLEGITSRGILLFDNPIVNPPIEIIKQSRDAIIRHFERIEKEGDDFIYEAKLTLVGDGSSGKTSLQRRILNEKAELPPGNDRTRGIKLHDWQFNDDNGKSYTTHIWDFGGQDVYYPVHRFFLTENSVYILMASTRFPVHNFEYWIPTIYQFGGGSPIIPVQTCDNGNQKDWTDLKAFYGIPEYNLKPVYQIDLSSSDNWGLKKLKNFIRHQVSELPHIGKTVPKSWVKVREKLIEKSMTHDYISFEKFEDLCKEIDQEAFSNPVNIEDLARFLHDLGIVLWYSNKDLLGGFIIIKPEWAMNAVYKIIDDTTIQQHNGIINQADFNRIWEEDTYKAKISELKLMLQVFKIAFPKQHQKQDYIIPARLKPIPDEKLWSSNEEAIRLEYHFDFMPRGIVNHLSADVSSKILSDEAVWSNAVILKHDDSLAQIVEETLKKKILIRAKGNDARGLMVLIMNSISNIIHEYKGVVPLLRVPCNCEKCQTLEKPYIFEYEKLIVWLKDGRKEVACNESEAKLSIFQLLHSVGLEKFMKENQTKKMTENEKTGDTYHLSGTFYAPIGNIGTDSNNTIRIDTPENHSQKKGESAEDKAAEHKAVKKWKMASVWWALGVSVISFLLLFIYENAPEMLMSDDTWYEFVDTTYETTAKSILSLIWGSFIVKMLYDRFSDPSKELNFRTLWKIKK